MSILFSLNYIKRPSKDPALTGSIPEEDDDDIKYNCLKYFNKNYIVNSTF